MKKKGFIILGAIIVLILVIIISVIVWYNLQLKAVNINSQNKVEVDISSGTKTTEILNLLKQKGLIKNETAAKMYIQLNDINNLQAGKYEFSPNMSLEQILNDISSGKIKDETVTLTFLEGKNMRYIASVIAENTKNSSNDVFKLLEDEEYIKSIIKKYWFLDESITNSSIYYPLEGYLYPETYKFENDEISVEDIFEKMLNQTDKILSKYKNQIESSKYSVHELLTMASIVELEGNNSDNRAKIARVIYNRLASNMSLGSDVTTYYAIKVDMGERDLYAREINTYNAYNTRGPNMEGKLPVGPIASVSYESIEAVLSPKSGKYLYFVADKNGEIYFSNTNEEHEQKITELRKRGLWYEYEE